MNSDDQHFLAMVTAYVETHPEVAAHVANHVQEGINLALIKAHERANDMESALVVACSKRWPDRISFIKNIINKWEGKTNFEWKEFLKN